MTSTKFTEWLIKKARLDEERRLCESEEVTPEVKEIEEPNLTPFDPTILSHGRLWKTHHDINRYPTI
jgi:hypothetical protein